MKKSIELEVFVDGKNKPICAKYLGYAGPHERCMFLRLKNFGTKPTCLFSNSKIMGNFGTDYLRPNDKCPLWGEGVVNV